MLEQNNEFTKNVFQKGGEDEIKRRFLNKWIELINFSEKNKALTDYKR